METLSLRLYCTCGSAWESTPMPLRVAAKMLREFSKAHTGDGHRLCDSRTATRARRADAARRHEGSA